MASSKKSSKHKDESVPETETKTTAKNVSEPESSEPEQQYVLATGLEDYGRWKAMFKDKKREDDPAFRRGRIWC